MKATVVGGGPAGLMAAEVLARAGFGVTVFEHKPSLGRKFLLAGRGGMNITHSEPIDSFLSRYGAARPDLEEAVRSWSPEALRDWCAELDETTFVGSSGRVFPKSFRATPLLRAWLARLTELGVEAKLRHRWVGFGDGTARPTELRFTDATGEDIAIASDVVVFALGGASWPRVGSDGGWVDAFRAADIEVRTLRPTNCGVRVGWSDVFIERFAGSPLKNVAVTVPASDYDGASRDRRTVRGDPIVTTAGLEGGPIYAHSAALRDELDRTGSATVHIDLHPDLPVERLVERLTKRRAKDSAATWLRGAGFSPVAISLLREATDNTLPGDAGQLAALAKAVPVSIDAMMPLERAISTAGGVSFDEVDESFMLHRRPGVYVVGEMLDWEAPTGGYLLQACFSTAVAAGRGATSWLQSGHA